jgi:hypothetical protein
MKVRELRAASGRAGGKQRQAKRQAVAKQPPEQLLSKPQATVQAKINPVPVPVPIREEEDARAPARESPYDLAWRVWTELWPGRWGEPYVRGTDTGPKGDDRKMQAIGAKAATSGARAEAELRSRLALFFADGSAWLVANRHPVRAFEADWNKYGSAAPPDPAALAAGDDDCDGIPQRKPTPEEVAERARWMDAREAQRKIQREAHAKVSADLARNLAAIGVKSS